MINSHHCIDFGAEWTCTSGAANYALPVARGVGCYDAYEYMDGQAAAPVDALLRESPCRSGRHREQTGEENFVN